MTFTLIATHDDQPTDRPTADDDERRIMITGTANWSRPLVISGHRREVQARVDLGIIVSKGEVWPGLSVICLLEMRAVKCD